MTQLIDLTKPQENVIFGIGPTDPESWGRYMTLAETVTPQQYFDVVMNDIAAIHEKLRLKGMVAARGGPALDERERSILRLVDLCRVIWIYASRGLQHEAEARAADLEARDKEIVELKEQMLGMAKTMARLSKVVEERVK
jgi:hypothetical protein